MTSFLTIGYNFVMEAVMFFSKFVMEWNVMYKRRDVAGISELK